MLLAQWPQQPAPLTPKADWVGINLAFQLGTRHWKILTVSYSLTLAELHVSVLMSFIKLIKLLQNLMKLLPNHIMV